MENAGIALSILASIALVVLGARDSGPSGKRMIVLGIVVLLTISDSSGGLDRACL